LTVGKPESVDGTDPFGFRIHIFHPRLKRCNGTPVTPSGLRDCDREPEAVLFPVKRVLNTFKRVKKKRNKPFITKFLQKYFFIRLNV
jgi:hypothetical protein